MVSRVIIVINASTSNGSEIPRTRPCPHLVLHLPGHEHRLPCLSARKPFPSKRAAGVLPKGTDTLCLSLEAKRLRQPSGCLEDSADRKGLERGLSHAQNGRSVGSCGHSASRAKMNQRPWPLRELCQVQILSCVYTLARVPGFNKRPQALSMWPGVAGGQVQTPSPSPGQREDPLPPSLSSPL